MINSEIILLCWTAASIGFIHTALGPDHYLPFVMMAKVRNWSIAKTSWITILSGSGHVLSSVALGLIGVYLGAEVMKLEILEAYRGTLAAWLLIGFGFAYFIWGIHKAIKNKTHSHVHVHGDGVIHDHLHSHTSEHAHVHDQKSTAKDITPWILFTVFVLGPCEPLIPLLMYPAAKSSIPGMFLVVGVFTITTLSTMLAIVLLSSWGIGFARLGKLEKYTHAIAGATICFAGLAIIFLGL
ncbi:MAG: sulfite exporter TauE/SafE family protein [Cyclobacteriaceae bacterium]|nr:sulfite exporter TauE/SafE family protein [Cyclobacteriaceae bacterium]MCK5277131.1 sulfite exporter TauE/SafE family protein [Cyclobacteriaceae bacterium]MCK5371750.1 sulfite exporter TauE/SafE family protein [Cyclobacteriaceae bacterium]